MSPGFDALDGDSLLLTINNRLAGDLRAGYDRAQAAAGRRVWASPVILPWNAWLVRLYVTLLDRGFTERDLLDPAQERLLWQDVIERHGASPALLRPAAAADAAMHTNSLVHAWQLDPQDLVDQGGGDTRTFVAWRQAFDRLLVQRGLLCTAQLTALVRDGFAQAALALPRRVLLRGFDSPTPAQRELFDWLRGNGCRIEDFVHPVRPAEVLRTEAADVETEMRLAAQWAGRRLRDDPLGRVAVVVPQIGQRRLDLQRIFRQILTPAGYLDPAAGRAPFNISLGGALGDCPLVAHAGLALGLLAGPSPLTAVGQLLRSPFIGGHRGEWEQRALFDADLRAEGRPQVDLQRLDRRLQHVDRSALQHCPDLAGRVARLRFLARELPGEAAPGQWMAHFRDALQILGWPGDAALDSEEFQQFERLQRQFGEFTALGKVRARMRLGEALREWQALTAATLFQPQSPAAPIQILGPLEAAGMDFDAIWLLGVHDQAWPPPPQPDPLLPTRLQRDLGMPHASATRELAFASALTERLARSAALLIASHAVTDGERQQRPSPLILDWPLRAATALALESAEILFSACRQPPPGEELPAARADGARGLLRGGATLLAAQANCPFQAAALFRLGARPLEEPSFNVDSALGGRLLHELLQRVWQRLGDSAALARHDDTALRRLIAPLADATLADVGRRRPDLFRPRFCAIEAARLTRLTIAWLEIERSRSQAFEVAALEQDQPIELEGLQLTARADRVDRLADGSLAVIDYKTGRTVSNQGWFDPRLSEPQLPLYCIQAGGAVSAALLARVRDDGPGAGFVGRSRDPGFAPGVTSAQDDQQAEWDELLRQWRHGLAELASEIGSGRIDPTPSTRACQYCPVGALCRVREMLLEDADA